MNDFDYDNLQRKRIARNARYRKNGSKSRKCTLPQDTMSAAELKRRNGEMSTYNLSQPMSYNTFKQMPDDLKREYILGLREKYNASAAKIGEMMGVSDQAMRQIVHNLGIAEKARRNMSFAQQLEWDKFVNPAPPPVEDFCEPEDKAPAEVAEAPVKKDAEKNVTRCSINSGILQFTGKAPDIAIAFMKFLGDCEYRISVEFEEIGG